MNRRWTRIDPPHPQATFDRTFEEFESILRQACNEVGLDAFDENPPTIPPRAMGSTAIVHSSSDQSSKDKESISLIEAVNVELAQLAQWQRLARLKHLEEECQQRELDMAEWGRRRAELDRASLPHASEMSIHFTQSD